MFEVTGVLRGTNKAGAQDCDPLVQESAAGSVIFLLHKAEWFRSTQQCLNFYIFTFPIVYSVKDIVLVDWENLLAV